MRILVINNSATVVDSSGRYFVHKSTGEFATDLVNLGNKVEFFQILNLHTSTNNGYDLKANGISVSGSFSRPSKVVTYLKAYCSGIRRLFSCDYLYFFYPSSMSFLLFTAILLRKKYGLYVRGEVGITNRLSNFFYRNADSIFTVADLFTARINEQLGCAKADTIKPMIPFTEEDIVSHRVFSDRRLFRILYIGRLDKDKGIFELVEAFSLLCNRSSYSLILDVVGDGGILSSLKSYASDLGVLENVNFCGAIGDTELIREFYLKSDVFVLPTYHEGFPRTLYEAMIFGTPIITTFVGAIPHLMKDDSNCFRIEPRSSESIYKKLSWVLEHYSRVGRVVENATKTVRPLILSSRPSHAEMLFRRIT